MAPISDKAELSEAFNLPAALASVPYGTVLVRVREIFQPADFAIVPTYYLACTLLLMSYNVHKKTKQNQKTSLEHNTLSGYFIQGIYQ